MTMAAQDVSVPRWHADAEPVEEIGPGMLTIAQVASLTGLNSQTIQVALNSDANTGRRARLRALSRPAYNFHGIPLWSPQQVADYHQVVASRWNVREEFRNLPIYSPEEVVKRQLTSLRGLSRLSGVPLTTLHRWKNSAGFPEPAALMRVESPTPRVLYSWPDFVTCLRNDHFDWLADHDVNLDKKVTDTAE